MTRRTTLSHRLVLVATLAASVLVGTGQRGDNPKVIVTVVIANQAAPLHILGFKLPEKVGAPHKLVVENLSSKGVTSFWTETMVGKARVVDNSIYPQFNGPTATLSGIFVVGQSKNSPIPPGGRVEVPQLNLASHPLSLTVSHVGSGCLHAAVLITRVEFADESIWYLDEKADRYKMWNASLSAESARVCADSKELDYQTLRKLKGFGYEQRVGTPIYAPQDPLASYVTSCSLRQDGYYWKAICPF